MFAYLFGLAPWDVDRLTLPQWQRFRRFADNHQQQGQQAQISERGMSRG